MIKLSMRSFEAKTFVEKQAAEIKRTLGNEKIIIACSGGVDSTTCAKLTHQAIGDNLVCVFIDTGFMRLNEPKEVVETFSAPPLSLPIKLVDARERFMNALRGLEDAEEKRKSFRDTFYSVLSEAARKERCRYLVQGTIAPDVIETKGGIKTQHNVLAQIGINPVKKYGFDVVEPVALLVKPQVREVANFLKFPSAIAKRQPFPGPGLSVRVVGEITPAKLDAVKKATLIVEEELENMAEQYFAAVIENEAETDPLTEEVTKTAAEFFSTKEERVEVSLLKSTATGIRRNVRFYGKIATIMITTEKGEPHKPRMDELFRFQDKILKRNSELTRVLYNLKKPSAEAPYLIAVRAVKTSDFITAQPASISWNRLEKLSERIIRDCRDVSAVYYDITPKPPATIEFE